MAGVTRSLMVCKGPLKQIRRRKKQKGERGDRHPCAPSAREGNNLCEQTAAIAKAAVRVLASKAVPVEIGNLPRLHLKNDMVQSTLERIL